MRFLIFVQFIQSQTQSRHTRHTAQHRGNGHFRRFEKTVEPRFGCEIWIGKVDTIYVHASRCFRLRLASVPMHFVVHKSAHAGASALRMHFPPSLFAVAVPKTTDALHHHHQYCVSLDMCAPSKKRGPPGALRDIINYPTKTHLACECASPKHPNTHTHTGAHGDCVRSHRVRTGP